MPSLPKKEGIAILNISLKDKKEIKFIALNVNNRAFYQART